MYFTTLLHVKQIGMLPSSLGIQHQRLIQAHMQGDSVYTMALNKEKSVVEVTAGRRTLV